MFGHDTPVSKKVVLFSFEKMKVGIRNKYEDFGACTTETGELKTTTDKQPFTNQRPKTSRDDSVVL